MGKPLVHPIDLWFLMLSPDQQAMWRAFIDCGDEGDPSWDEMSAAERAASWPYVLAGDLEELAWVSDEPSPPQVD